MKTHTSVLSLLLAASLLSGCGSSSDKDKDRDQNSDQTEIPSGSIDGDSGSSTGTATDVDTGGMVGQPSPPATGVTNLCGARGGWQLDVSLSQLSFVTTKKTDVVESHRFDQLSGAIDNNWQATLDIDLASVNTGIELRDQRMAETLFETASFSTASVSIDLFDRDGAALSASDNAMLEKDLSLNLHGISASSTAQLSASCVDNNTLMVKTRQPLLIEAADHNLMAGVEALRQMAGLDVINPIVPVDLVLIFKRS